uniref:Uncharacterized protein n=1 Tax=Chromera velia CCMP2878 TaxID=1169474 RepID=A0A0G4GZ33_9ALVE|eukprot:Cvel_23995.t1-p1 / transcript=Cvel_23995.t1 / gene=Cvel_23995 / organism=Chromera_velia_CCMP2878 / gene_product=hypothetical protein / transcript_product=hypothetical protein / location=Cvel_scaffold2543:13594-14052(-) / protein_length=153 / sequence_SO=supercontig / SO=protein_coding / is_pseudo=false
MTVLNAVKWEDEEGSETFATLGDLEPSGMLASLFPGAGRMTVTMQLSIPLWDHRLNRHGSPLKTKGKHDGRKRRVNLALLQQAQMHVQAMVAGWRRHRDLSVQQYAELYERAVTREGIERQRQRQERGKQNVQNSWNFTPLRNLINSPCSLSL